MGATKSETKCTGWSGQALTCLANGGSADSAADVCQEAVQQLEPAAVLQDHLGQRVVILQLLQNLHHE